ncbi:hypothetical protein [Acinetobacter sp. c3-l95]|uniref:DUF968 domain-containing protein n=1 Tax=Acinetobacter sp. c3-l95 TaxID=3342804 RepID=UPI0035B7F2F0
MNQKRLQAIRQLHCVQCGMTPPSQACHSNFVEHGKGMGIKADDKYTIALCHQCHVDFDQYKGKNREQSKVWFLRMLKRTNRALLNNDDGEF